MADASFLTGLADLQRLMQQRQEQSNIAFQPTAQTEIPSTSSAMPSTQSAANQGLFSALQAPTQAEGGRPLTTWEQWGTPDTGLALSSILGNLALAVDPQGWGGRMGGAMSRMSQGEMSARNAAERVFEQRQSNQQLMELYKALLGSQIGSTATTR